jgi:hypothetical protein
MGLYMVGFVVLPWWLMVGEPIPEEKGEYYMGCWGDLHKARYNQVR